VKRERRDAPDEKSWISWKRDGPHSPADIRRTRPVHRLQETAMLAQVLLIASPPSIFCVSFATFPSLQAAAAMGLVRRRPVSLRNSGMTTGNRAVR
jgi:hypothetical protein